jgi:hypothetical protein
MEQDRREERRNAKLRHKTRSLFLSISKTTNLTRTLT